MLDVEEGAQEPYDLEVLRRDGDRATGLGQVMPTIPNPKSMWAPGL